ncbi:MAG: phasin family protein [Scytolyngbya sp. HA4215-MV1]|nr:phasin family protein [Scytolyngbya sp. HA4215-MV1]
MPGFGDLVQKAVYLGIGLASYAGEKAGGKLTELKTQVQKLADEMVERGEMSAEEARKFVDEMVSRAQQVPSQSQTDTPSEPRRIEILSDDEEPPISSSQSSATQGANPPTPDRSSVEEMRRQVLDLQEELRRLKRD